MKLKATEPQRGRSAAPGELSSGRAVAALSSERGFALVISLALMVLLTVLAVGLLGLSSISLRTSARSGDMAHARSQARLGLMLALGELQSELGPDRRVSAAAFAVNEAPVRPHLLGVWDAWRRPAGDASMPNYGEKQDKFRSWLVSTGEPSDASDPALPGKDPGSAAAGLVGTGGQGISELEVKAEKVVTANAAGDPEGAYAWAVFDESQKAAIQLGDPESLESRGAEIGSRSAPPRVRADVLAGELAGLKEPRNLLTLETASLAGGGPGAAAEVRRRFHDFTTRSIGLLTNTAEGGMRNDLTQYFEEGLVPESGEFVYGSDNGGLRWSYLLDHYGRYKQLESAASGRPWARPEISDRELANSFKDQGIKPTPPKERLFPIISKFQLVFSIVSHHHHSSDRVAYHENNAVPKGNERHAVPHLAYDPVVTLYNPYDVALRLDRLRVRVSDPPVGFRFAKIDNQKNQTIWYRREMAAGQFHGLGRFQIAHERNANPPPKNFTLVLTDGDSEAAGKSLMLEPGAVKVFAMRVEKSWSWRSEFSNRTFFDWDYGLNAGNMDHRSGNRFGVEAVPGWDARAGLQTDHMSYAGREPETLYDFEKDPKSPWGGGFLSMRITDDIRVEAKAQRTAAGSATPDLLVELMAGKNIDTRVDLVRSYRFHLADPVAEMSEDPANPVISRDFLVEDTLQKPDDRGVAGKKPFAMLEMTARTTRDPLDDSKPWLYNNPVVEGARLDTKVAGLVHDSYDLRLVEMQSFTSFPGIEFDPATKRGYHGASKSANGGSSNVPMFSVPVVPMSSLGDWVHANLTAGGVLPRVVHALGNSRALPLLDTGSLSRSLGGNILRDHSYLLNESLWDRYYFSALTDYGYPGSLLGDGRGRKEVLTDTLAGSRPPLNSRLVPIVPVGDAAAAAAEIEALPAPERAVKLAAYLGIAGPFNVNSTSVDAWRAVLGSWRDRLIHGWSGKSFGNESRTPFPRSDLPLMGADGAAGGPGGDVLGDPRWAGFRSLDDAQIERLAREIVSEIRKRGQLDQAPSLSLGEFVNRRVGPADGLHGLAGLLQTAIDQVDRDAAGPGGGINTSARLRDGKEIDGATIPGPRKKGVITPSLLDGSTAEGSPTLLTQGDLMRVLGPVATVRGDSFKIRGYGEARAKDGTVLATARCEAVVQRMPRYLDPVDPAERPESALESPANQTFGRRFEVVSFRWLSTGEL